jgi:hypothetical protein
MESPPVKLSDDIKQNAVVMRVLEHVAQCSDNCTKLDQQLHDMHHAISDDAIRMSDGLSVEDAQTLARALYWTDDKHIPIDSIATIYGCGVHPRKVHEHMGTCTIHTSCACGETVYIIVHSRDEKRNVFKHIKDARSKRRWPFKCAACQEKEQAEIEQKLAARKRQDESLTAISVEALRNMPYEEYLQTEHWAAVRTAALRRANYACQLCNAKGRLNVHHRTYENCGREQPSDLIVLCEGCHAKVHDKVAS